MRSSLDLFQLVASGKMTAEETADLAMLRRRLATPRWVRAVRWLWEALTWP